MRHAPDHLRPLLGLLAGGVLGGCVPAVTKPGVYAPVSEEVADLKAAHAQGLLSDAELAEFTAMVEAQGRKLWVRRRPDAAPLAVPFRLQGSENRALIERSDDP